MAKVIKPVERPTGNFLDLGTKIQELNSTIINKKGIEEDSLKVKKSDVKDYCIAIPVNEKIQTTLERLYFKFLLETKNTEFRLKKDFFRIMLLEMEERLKANNAYVEAPKNSIVMKAGRRSLKGDRVILKADKIMIAFRPYNDDTLQKFHNISHSLMLMDNMENIKQYSRTYFFIDILDFTQQNITEIIKKYKSVKK